MVGPQGGAGRPPPEMAQNIGAWLRLASRQAGSCVPLPALVLFERHDEPGAEEEEDEEECIVAQVRPLVHAVQVVVLQDSLPVCQWQEGGGGGQVVELEDNLAACQWQEGGRQS